ncbi:heterokaryon incompatibility protein-domain-containing protein [Nemania sp. FL0031]|nr:heterokaryon incompatibility protein-domain-containing protein [Nemania sp. FL0031]
MSIPTSQKDAAPSKHFCSWCTAWKANGEIDVVGYIEPSPQMAAIESQKHEDWIRKLQVFTQREERGEVGKNDSLAQNQDAAEKAPETTRFLENGDEIATCSDKMKVDCTKEIGDNSQEASNNDDEEAEVVHDPDAKARVALDLPPPRRVPDLIESADTCFLCNKLWEAFNTWAIEKYGSLDCLDMSTSRVEVGGRWPKRLSEEGEESANYSGYGYDGVHGRLCFLKVSITVREPGNSERWAGPSVTLQKSYQVAPSVADIFDSDEHFGECDPLMWPDNEPYVARKRPLVADMRLFQKWEGLCSATHDHRCRPGRIPFDGKHRLTTLRLIDVDTFSLIEIKDVEDMSWVTLSYVWGLAPFRTLMKDNLEEFKEAGALGASWVPTTIADAIQVTKGIGERYLWVDSLCIIQDSYADKANFIPYMDVIYGRACVTIINASGDGAFGGLPGVRPNTRFQAEEPFELDGTWFMQSHKKMGEYKMLGDSKWFTRGWTFQEAILSPRWLVFTPEQVYWECRQATWREDACWELPHFRQKNQTIIYEPGFDDAFQDLWTLSSIEKFDKTYQCLVNC